MPASVTMPLTAARSWAPAAGAAASQHQEETGLAKTEHGAVSLRESGCWSLRMGVVPDGPARGGADAHVPNPLARGCGVGDRVAGSMPSPPPSPPGAGPEALMTLPKDPDRDSCGLPMEMVYRVVGSSAM